ncbi:MAG: DUF1761 family protein [Polyangiales bacterium]
MDGRVGECGGGVGGLDGLVRGALRRALGERVRGEEQEGAHAKAVPPYTCAVQLLCTVVLVLSLAVFQQLCGVNSVGGALATALFVILGFSVSTGLPGQAFLKRWRVAAIAYGSQAAMILVISLVLGIWR